MKIKNRKKKRRIFERTACQKLYKELLSYYISPEEAKNKAISYYTNNIELNFEELMQDKQERYNKLKENDQEIREKNSLSFNYIVLDGKILKIEFILKVNKAGKNAENYTVKIEETKEEIIISRKKVFISHADAKRHLANVYKLKSSNATLVRFLKEVENVNSLPRVEDLFNMIGRDLEEQGLDEWDIEEVIDNLWDEWDETYLELKDGTDIKLLRFKQCVNHSPYEVYSDFLYKIDDNLYVCGECLELVFEHGHCDARDYVFPRNWSEHGIEVWIEKHTFSKEHIAKCMAMVDNEYGGYDSYDNEYDEYDGDYKNIRLSDINARNNCFNSDKCQEIYKALVELECNPNEARRKAINIILSGDKYDIEEIKAEFENQVSEYRLFTSELEEKLGRKLNFVKTKKETFEIDYIKSLTKNEKSVKVKLVGSNKTNTFRLDRIYG